MIHIPVSTLIDTQTYACCCCFFFTFEFRCGYIMRIRANNFWLILFEKKRTLFDRYSIFFSSRLLIFMSINSSTKTAAVDVAMIAVATKLCLLRCLSRS